MEALQASIATFTANQVRRLSFTIGDGDSMLRLAYLTALETAASGTGFSNGGGEKHDL
jgi:hypothetical protein